jgi:hypothetical protein
VGVFRDWQPRYLEQGIATFPMAFERLDDGKINKKPLVRGYLRIGTERSRELASKPQFAECNGIGFRVDQLYGGPRLTILDIDTTDEGEVPKAIERHGDTPIIVRTATGKHHLYYRYNGEPRLLKAWGDAVPIDLLGGGFVVAPPSIGPQGSYEFVRGDLAQIKNLPAMRGVENKIAKQETPKVRPGIVREGNRNRTLWERCMLKAKRVERFDDLLAFARDYNGAHMQPPLSDMEIIRAATSAWEYQVRGENFFGGAGNFVTCPTTMLEDLMQSNSDALALMMVIRSHNWHRERFYVANAMADKLGWTLPRFREARALLVGRKYLRVLSPATAHRPTEYGWPHKPSPPIGLAV